MTHRAKVGLLVGVLVTSALWPMDGVHAQTQRPTTIVRGGTSAVLPVRTFTLRQLAVRDAAKLLTPYLQSAGSGAFETGTGVGAITIRGSSRELELADSLLTRFDRAPSTVRLRFQFIEPIGAPAEDARISEVVGALHELFDAPGYRLLGEGMVTTDEARRFAVSISAGKSALHVTGTVQQAAPDDSALRLQVDVHQNAHDASKQAVQPLFRGSLTVPAGKLVVLGSAVPLLFFDTSDTSDTSDTADVASRGTRRERYGQRTIILTVRPQVEHRP